MSRRKVGSVRGGSSNTSGSVRGGSTSSRPTTPPPGQSVAPGSIVGQTPWSGRTWSNNPEYVGNARNEGFNTLAWIQTLLSNMNNGGSYGQGFSDLLNTILQQIAVGGKNTALSPDMIQALFMNLLQYQATSEGREYDYKMLNESRLYNNPQNELARLMGAGVSRDAAIQFLSGAAGAQGSGSGSGVAPVVGPAAGAGAAALNSSNAQANFFDNLFNGIQLVANLFQQGVDMYSSIQTAQMLSAQNYMTQEQLTAYKDTNAITTALSNAITQGIIEPADLEGWNNADDVYKWLLDHSETNFVKPLIESGSVNGVFGTTLGREMFNRHWQQQRESRDAGTLYSNYVKGSFIDNDLKAANRDNLTQQAELYKEEIQQVRASAEYQSAMAALTRSQKDAQELQNDLDRSWRTPEAMNNYRDAIVNRLYGEAFELRGLRNSPYYQNKIDYMLKDQELAQTMVELGFLYKSGELKVMKDMDTTSADLLYLARAYDECGVFKYLELELTRRMGRPFKFGPFSVQESPSMPTLKSLNNINPDPNAPFWQLPWQ